MPKLNDLQVKRVNINLPIKLIERVQEYSRNMGIPYTQGYTILLNQALQQQDNLKTLTNFTDAVKLVSNMNEEERNKLSDIVNSNEELPSFLNR